MTMERVQRERRAFIGSPQTIVALVQNAVELFGDVEPSLSVLWGNMPYEAAERSLRLFASDVMPRFAPAPATRAARCPSDAGQPRSLSRDLRFLSDRRPDPADARRAQSAERASDPAHH